MEQIISKQRIIAELARSPHGDLKEYIPIAMQAVKHEPEFLAHLIAWNAIKGQIRDSKVALPVCSLQPGFAFAENSLAHLATLDPRNFVRALRFAKEAKVDGNGRALRRLVERYLRAREANLNWWIRTVVQHRASMKTLYAMYHVKPSVLCDSILFKGMRPAGSPLAAIADLKNMSPQNAAGAIAEHKIPFLIAVQALGANAKNTDFVMTLIDNMSPAELVTNAKMLEKLGIREVPALRAAYEAGLTRIAESKTVTLKTSKAAESVTDVKLKAKLEGAQAKQMQKISVDGNWLVLGDKSGSMAVAIETSRHVAATLAKLVSGEVHLVFFDNQPRHIDVTGKSYEQVLAATRTIAGSGGTSIGCGVAYAIEKGWDIDGIVVVSDGGENGLPWFHEQYKKFCIARSKDVPVYFYKVRGADGDSFTGHMHSAGIEMQTFDLTQSEIDYYALPNLVQTMRCSRFSLIDEIMETSLLTLDDVFKTAATQHAA